MEYSLRIISVRHVLLLLAVVRICIGFTADACTSMIVSAGASATGRPLLWKHRDTGAAGNFLSRVEAAPEAGREYGFVGLYNNGDSLLTEAWMGMNDAGFALMNTASYNLAPDTTDYKDREGIVMSHALGRCRTVDDFAAMLDTLPKPLGVQANFGVIDAGGNGAYFETNDYGYVRYDVDDSASGILVRTNFSFSGTDTGGKGYLRYETVETALEELADKGIRVSPEFLTDFLSCSFRHPLLGNVLESEAEWTVDQDFIPRPISTSSIVIEGVKPGLSVDGISMRAVLGYPPCSHAESVGLHSIPEGLAPTSRWSSTVCEEAMRACRELHPIRRGNGPVYLDLRLLREVLRDK